MGFSSGGSDQDWFKDSMVYVTDDDIEEAITYVDSIQASGGRLTHFSLKILKTDNWQIVHPDQT